MSDSTKTDYRNQQRKFDFTLYLNEHIIVQRMFNVIGFNPKAIHSLNFKDAIDYNKEIIQYHLQNKSLDYMTANTKQFYADPSFNQNNSDDVIKLIVRMDNKIIAEREWDATIYPTDIRHSVDIREHIYDLITRVQKCLSEKDNALETTYLGYSLTA